ncbi:hypothetical protein Syun_021858 [Stephania yunnanensis]|uniref:CDP-diacylglycerol--serine O-phosphatidyltransferase n=1 Tax=Stephania yunnanensis TaxID=152371 RepID=A0AAP0NSM7_9MAGN
MVAEAEEETKAEASHRRRRLIKRSERGHTNRRAGEGSDSEESKGERQRWDGNGSGTVNGQRKARRRDMITGENGVVNGPNSNDELDPWTAWAYKPRTVSFLLIGACLLIWASGALNPEKSISDDLVYSVKRGVWAMIAVFLTYCLLQAPSTVLIRPHPAIWRLVHGLAVIYLVALTFLLFQKRDDARQFMKFLHPDLGVELPERSYGADCRIYLPDNPSSRFKNVYETLFDEFVPAHIFGWWGKAIMIRNQPLLWVLSIGFELMEVYGQECILSGKANIRPVHACAMGQGRMAPFARSMALILWWLIAIPTIREYNSYLQDRKPVKKVGAFCWLSLAICIVELLICIKFGHGLFPNSMPLWLVIFWASIGVALLIFIIIWSWQSHRALKRKRH